MDQARDQRHLRNQGFSLVEILLVIAVITILLGIGVVNLQAAAARQRLNEASRTLSETLLDIADKAAAESRYIVVDVSADKISWRDQASGQAFGERSFPHGATVSPTSTFEYTGRGLPPEGPQTFVMTTTAGSRSIYLLATGAVVIR